MKKLLWFSISLSLLTVSCNRDGDVGVICEIDNATQAVTLTSPLNVSNNIDMSLDQVTNITAQSDVESYWEVTIKGDSSNLLVKYSGCGNTVNVTWDGKVPNRPPAVNETCTVTLDFPKSSGFVAQTASVTVTNAIDYNANGLLVSSIDNIGDFFIGRGFSFSSSEVYGRLDSTGGGRFASLFFQRDIDDDDNSPFNVDVGYIEFQAGTNTTVTYNITETNPENVYINFFVYSSGAPGFNFTPILNKNSNLGFIPTSRFAIASEFDRPLLATRGWKFYSFRLSDLDFVEPFVFSNAPSGEVPSVSNIMSIRINFFMRVPGDVNDSNLYHFAVDNPVITYGGPLEF